jgi:hypothetical protein
MITQTIYTSNQLLSICNAELTQTNICIAQTIINMYMQAKTFFQEDMISCMQEFLSNGSLNFRKYNIKF